MKNIDNQEFKFDYVGFGTRIGATIIDILIIVPIVLIITLIFKDTIIQSREFSILLRIIINILIIIYKIFFTVTYGGTPGKLATKIRIISERGNYLTVDRAFLRLLPNLFYTIISASVRHSMGNDINLGLSFLLDLILILDVSLIAFNDKKKALHDYLASSYVVTNESLLRKQGSKSVNDLYID
ncbi:RDD family protein [Wukongibacter baidiensis]|uniref:RDD family protein n=1 Tax=Wukongibacter baidiensis TaxID=1723361 RepID=UPI003D7F1B91